MATITIQVPDSPAMRRVLLSLAEMADGEADLCDSVPEWKGLEEAYTAFGVAVNEALQDASPAKCSCAVCEGRPRDARAEWMTVCAAAREKATLMVASWDSEGEAHYRDEDLIDALVDLADDAQQWEPK